MGTHWKRLKEPQDMFSLRNEENVTLDTPPTSTKGYDYTIDLFICNYLPYINYTINKQVTLMETTDNIPFI